MTEVINILSVISAIGYHIWATRHAFKDGYTRGYASGAQDMRDAIFNQMGILSNGENPPEE